MTRPRPEATSCPLCAGEALRALVASDLNRRTSEERFEYARCRSCGAYFLRAPPTDMSPYYPNEYYALPSEQLLASLARSQRPNVQLMLGQVGPGRLLEIGPGEGAFARAAQDAGFDVTAIEMDSRLCEHLRAVAGIGAINSAFPEEVVPTLPASKAIVLRHVIEHLPRPWEVLAQAAANLEPGGVLAIAAPNPRSLQFGLLRRRWAHLDAPRHLFLIPPETLARRCSQLGLRLRSTTTADPDGRHWNRFGWEYALRRSPRSRHATRASGALGGLIARALAPIETRSANGCAYTSIFVKPSSP